MGFKIFTIKINKYLIDENKVINFNLLITINIKVKVFWSTEYKHFLKLNIYKNLHVTTLKSLYFTVFCLLMSWKYSSFDTYILFLIISFNKYLKT